MDGHATTVSLQRESSLGGSLTGTRWEVPAASVMGEPRFVERHGTVDVWRHQEGQSAAGLWHELNLQSPLFPDQVLHLLLDSLLVRTGPAVAGDGGSTSGSAPGTVATQEFSMPRAGRPLVDGLSVMVAYPGGPWVRYAGCRLQEATVSARPRQQVSASYRLVCASRTSYGSDPGWGALAQPSRGIALPALCTAVHEGQEMGECSAFSFSLRRALQPSGFNRAGQPADWATVGPMAVFGELGEFLDSTQARVGELMALSEVALEFTAASRSGRRLGLSVPVALFESGDQPAKGPVDLATTQAWRGSSRPGQVPTATLVSPLQGGSSS